MRYAISYVSSAVNDLDDGQVNRILQQTNTHNNNNDITGLLVYSEGNFFQLIEGEKEAVRQLYYNKIEKDPRHKNIIKFLEKEIHEPSYDGYHVDMVTSRFDIDQSKMQTYIDYVKVLQPEVRQPVLNILKSFLPKI
ncbi:MAG: blue light sensor protein [Flavobacteriaceae bacterium]|nr:blue light sensor protein [Flavobacteriaceae bacterium]